MPRDENTKIQFIRFPSAGDLDPPAHATTGAAGLDLRAAIPADQTIILQPMTRVLVPTGFGIILPPQVPGFPSMIREAQVRPRSGLALKSGISIANTPGTIDQDYRGEIKLILINLGDQPFEIRRGDRLAQLVIGLVERVVDPPVVDARTIDNGGANPTAGHVPESVRGTGGFGSTGV